MNTDIGYPSKITWCPGCGDFGILSALKKAIENLIKGGIKRENIVVFTGIGCHAKIVDYLNVNTFYSLHGRAIPPALGAKLANPNLHVIVCSGDGDSFDEGLDHLIYAAKRNANMTVILHDNRVFALTTGQYTALSPKGFKGKSTPQGAPETPLNPHDLLMAAGATFLARSYSAKIDHLANMIEKAVLHKGFSFVEVLQPCMAWLNPTAQYNEKVYEFVSENLAAKGSAIAKIREWDYVNDGKIPIGIFFEQNKPAFEEMI